MSPHWRSGRRRRRGAARGPPERAGRGVIIAKAGGVLAGLPLPAAVFAAVEGSRVWRPLVEDGDRVAAGDRVAGVEGTLASILCGERVALNYLTHLSGVATAAAAVVRALAGTGCRLRGTRKTIPGLRGLPKYAARVGGGT